MIRMMMISAALTALLTSVTGCPNALSALEENQDQIPTGACSDGTNDEVGDDGNLSEAVTDDAVTCEGYDLALDPELAGISSTVGKAELTESGLRDWSTVPGTQQPIVRRRTDDGRTFRFYTAEVVNRVTGEHGVVVSVFRSNRGAWERRILRAQDLNELAGPVAMRGYVLRSWLGDLWDDIRDGVDDLIDGLSGAARQFTEILRQVGALFTKFGELLIDAADTIDENIAAYYAKAASEVQNSPIPLHQKLQYAIDRATQLDPSKRTTRGLALAILRVN